MSEDQRTYLTAIGPTGNINTISDYLYTGLGARIIHTEEVGNRQLAVVEIPAGQAFAQSARLASGLMGGQRFDTEAAARYAVAQRAEALRIVNG